MKLFRGWQGATAVPDSDTGLTSPPTGPDNGPVIVLVDPRGSDTDALEWAAAEAAARGSELRIVYAFRWPRLLDPLGNLTVDLRAREAAEAVVTAAIHRARRIAPSLRITATLYPRRQVAALLTEATDGALMVLSHSRKSGRFERVLARRLVRRTTASLAVIGLSAAGSVGPSAGRVVVGIDDKGGPSAALGFAFRAARRRGTGLTVVHATGSTRRAEIEDTVRSRRTAYPEVDLRWAVAPGPVDSVVLAESAAAALAVLGPDRRGRLRQAVSGSEAYNVLHLARGPVVIVGTVGVASRRSRVKA